MVGKNQKNFQPERWKAIRVWLSELTSLKVIFDIFFIKIEIIFYAYSNNILNIK
jgi:hypothetical protein